MDKEKLYKFIVIISVFIGFLLFYITAHPLYIYDTDDWTYIAAYRHAYPCSYEWNPSKVLPETLMPLVSMLGIRLFYGFTGDYIISLAIAFAICLSAFLFYMYYWLLHEYFNVSGEGSMLLTALLVIMHFMVYNNSGSERTSYFFYSGNVCCIFNYVIPFLINSAFVFHIIRNGGKIFVKGSDASTYIKNGIIILWLYMCITSNLYHSGILVIWLGTEMLFSAVDIIKENRKSNKGIIVFLRDFIMNNMEKELPILFWLFCCILDINGGRAKMLESSRVGVRYAAKGCLNDVLHFNKLFLLGCLCVVIMFVIIYVIYNVIFKKKCNESKCFSREEINLVMKEIVALSVMTIFLPLVLSRTGGGSGRWDIMCCWTGLLILLVITMGTYIIKKNKWMFTAIPLMIFILMFESIIDGKVYYDVNLLNSNDLTMVKGVGNSIIDQVLTAQDAGFDRVNVYIPYTENDGWPIAAQYGGRISNALYSLGITHKWMDITLIMDKSVNEKWHMD